jgi:methionyl-tRNA formyltransferase
MKKISKTVVFFGSGPVAAASLQKLHQDFNIEAIVTKPRAPHHKGSVPVIELAEELDIAYHTVDSKQTLDALIATQPFKSDIAVLIDFGIIVSRQVIDYFKLGIINSHFSILPEWRGADPITYAILSGQKSTGVSLMKVNEAMDEGPLIAYDEYDIPSDIDTPHLTKALISLSHELLCKNIPLYIQGKIAAFAQDSTGRPISYSRKISSADAMLNFSKTADELAREIRAYKGWPGSKLTIGDKSIIITKAHVVDMPLSKGQTKIIDKDKLMIGTKDKSLSVDEVRPAGKTTMPIKAFLAGNSHLLR